MLELFLSIGLGAAVVALCFMAYKLGESENEKRHEKKKTEAVSSINRVRIALRNRSLAQRLRDRFTRK